MSPPSCNGARSLHVRRFRFFCLAPMPLRASDLYLPDMNSVHAIETRLLQISDLPPLFGGPCVVPTEVVEEVMAKEMPIAIELTSACSTPSQAIIFVWLPEAKLHQLMPLASAVPHVVNLESADLRRSRTHLTWESARAGLTVLLDTWELPHLVRPTAEPTLAVAFAIPGGHVAVTVHRISGERLDDLLIDLQCAASTTGPNYKPWRYHSDEELAAAEGRQGTADPSVIVPRVKLLRHSAKRTA